MYIYQYGFYSQTVQEQVSNLKADVKQCCGQHIRRVDRFIQLSLIGAHQCIGAARKLNNCALYLSSAEGSKSNTIAAIKEVFIEHNPLMPLDFIRQVSNVACYHVAQTLDIENIGLFVASPTAPLEKALHLAELDLLDADCEEAFVGLVDECAEPIAAQRNLLQATVQEPIGESSFWLLLGLAKEQAIAKVEENRVFHSAQALLEAIQSKINQRTQIAVSRNVSTDAKEVLSLLNVPLWGYSESLPLQKSQTGYAVDSFMQQDKNTKLLHIDASEEGLLYLLSIEKVESR